MGQNCVRGVLPMQMIYFLLILILPKNNEQQILVWEIYDV